MPVSGLDHVAIPTGRPDELIAFYRSLGFEILHEAEWRSGAARIFALACGASKVNVHPPELWSQSAFTLRGPEATPGCGDLCFVWDGSVEDLRSALAAAGAIIEEGPVPREGGRGDIGTSIYTRDPDRNLVEFIVYE